MPCCCCRCWPPAAALLPLAPLLPQLASTAAATLLIARVTALLITSPYGCSAEPACAHCVLMCARMVC
jgi:hypothetical protein